MLLLLLLRRRRVCQAHVSAIATCPHGVQLMPRSCNQRVDLVWSLRRNPHHLSRSHPPALPTARGVDRPSSLCCFSLTPRNALENIVRELGAGDRGVIALGVIALGVVSPSCDRQAPAASVRQGAWWVIRTAADGVGAEQHAPVKKCRI